MQNQKDLVGELARNLIGRGEGTLKVVTVYS